MSPRLLPWLLLIALAAFARTQRIADFASMVDSKGVESCFD